ncbi:hypothetical protein EM6_1613 [Asticcacaulis excentricus]|uniref:Uncharacterized protein n=1 Tax=Asticcacaulis excentricus TaxID=78587 RepID=A0A3G9G9G2_9CAUL|nr:hypothetical protein EM6_1613 [Asticcacaulis excentricus]
MLGHIALYGPWCLFWIEQGDCRVEVVNVTGDFVKVFFKRLTQL